MQSPDRGALYRLKGDDVGKKRPVVIVSRKQLNGGLYVLAIPFTTQQIERHRHMANYVLFDRGEGGLDEQSHAKCGEITFFRMSDLRISEGPIGQFDPAQMDRLLAGIKWVLEIEA